MTSGLVVSEEREPWHAHMQHGGVQTAEVSTPSMEPEKGPFIDCCPRKQGSFRVPGFKMLVLQRVSMADGEAISGVQSS